MSHISKMIERLSGGGGTHTKTQTQEHAQPHMYTETYSHKSTYRHTWRACHHVLPYPKFEEDKMIINMENKVINKNGLLRAKFYLLYKFSMA